jgi:hypothetical protein
MPMERLTEQTYDRRAGWQNQIFMYGDCAFSALGCTFVSLFSFYGYQARGKVCGALVLILSGLSGVVCGIAYLATGRPYEAIDACLRSPVAMVCGVSLIRGENHIVLGLLIYGTWLMLLPWIQTSIFNRNALSGMNKVPIAGIIILTLGILISVARQYLLFKAKRTIKKDMDAYNRAWDAMMERPNTAAALDRLASVSERANQAHMRPKDWAPRQYNRLKLHITPENSSTSLRTVSSSWPIPTLSTWSCGAPKILPLESEDPHDTHMQSAANENPPRLGSHGDVCAEVPPYVASDATQQLKRLGLDYSSPITSLDQVMAICMYIHACIHTY